MSWGPQAILMECDLVDWTQKCSSSYSHLSRQSGEWLSPWWLGSRKQQVTQQPCLIMAAVCSELGSSDVGSLLPSVHMLCCFSIYQVLTVSFFFLPNVHLPSGLNHGFLLPWDRQLLCGVCRCTALLNPILACCCMVCGSLFCCCLWL